MARDARHADDGEADPLAPYYEAEARHGSPCTLDLPVDAPEAAWRQISSMVCAVFEEIGHDAAAHTDPLDTPKRCSIRRRGRLMNLQSGINKLL
jgi:hypothetical protein